MRKTYKYTNEVEEQVIAKIDGDKEEQTKQWRVTNLPNGEEDRLFVSKASADMWAAIYKRNHNLSNPVVEKING